jgi:hypothetical protein
MTATKNNKTPGANFKTWGQGIFNLNSYKTSQSLIAAKNPTDLLNALRLINDRTAALYLVIEKSGQRGRRYWQILFGGVNPLIAFIDQHNRDILNNRIFSITILANQPGVFVFF